MEEELICSICCCYFQDAMTASCSHSFCKVCITNWQKNRPECPICRQSIQYLTSSRALNALSNAARERMVLEESNWKSTKNYIEKELNKCIEPNPKANVSKGVNTTTSLNGPSGSGTNTCRARSTLATICNRNTSQTQKFVTIASGIAGLAVGMASNKLAHNNQTIKRIENIVSTIGRSSEVRDILRSTIQMAIGRTLPGHILDAVFIACEKALPALSLGKNISPREFSEKLASLIESQLYNYRHVIADSNNSSDNDGDSGNDQIVSIKLTF